MMTEWFTVKDSKQDTCNFGRNQIAVTPEHSSFCTHRELQEAHLTQRIDAVLQNLCGGLVLINAKRDILHINSQALYELKIQKFSDNISTLNTFQLKDIHLQQRLDDFIELSIERHALFPKTSLSLYLCKRCRKSNLCLKIVPLIIYRDDIGPPADQDGKNTEFIISINDHKIKKNVDLSQPTELYELSRAEASVLDLVIQGKSNKEIARLRAVRENTVKSQLKSLMTKTNCDNRTMLVFRALSCTSTVC